MSDKERWGTRSLLVSDFHRTHTLVRYGMDESTARRLTCIDVDFLEYCDKCRKPIAVIEVTRDVGQVKPTTVIRELASAAGIKAFLVRYRQNEDGTEVSEFGIQKVFPTRSTMKWVQPETFGPWLVKIRGDHSCWSHTAVTRDEAVT